MENVAVPLSWIDENLYDVTLASITSAILLGFICLSQGKTFSLHWRE